MDREMDEELRKRLTDYTREPNEKMWAKIVPHISIRQKNGMNRMGKGIDLFTVLILVACLLSILLNLPDSYPAYSEVSDPAKMKSQQAKELTRNDEGGTNNLIQIEAIAPLFRSSEEQESEQTSEPSDIHVLSSEIAAETDQSAPLAQYAIMIENSGEKNTSNIPVVKTGNEIVKEPVNGVKEIMSEEEKPKTKEEKKEERIQEREQNERTHRKFSIYFTAMPTFGYQRIESKTNDKIYIESIKKISAFSTERLGLRAELGAEIPLSRRLKVFGGVLYYQRKQTIDYTEKQIDTTQVSIGSNGEYVVETKLTHSDKSFEYELKNIGFQVGLTYQLKKAKFLQSLGTGIEFQFALNNLSEEVDNTLTNNPSAYVFYNLYYRLQYPSEGRLKAVFQPTLNYSFYINQNLNAPFYVKPYGLGLNVGATYNF
jgi:hypothetical protein